jgi:tetratricopeptide (TPR) repeat protein
MEYDRQLLKSWVESGDWGDYLEAHGALDTGVSTYKFKAIEKRYFDEIKIRIAYCEKLLISQHDAFIYYALAVLYSRCDLNESASFLHMERARFYGFKAIRKDPNFAPSWALLAECYSWIATLSESREKRISYIENAIRCIKRALKTDPSNVKYLNLFKSYYSQRNDYFG